MGEILLISTIQNGVNKVGTVLESVYSLVMSLCSHDIIIIHSINSSMLTGLNCSKMPGFWMVEHQLVVTSTIGSIPTHLFKSCNYIQNVFLDSYKCFFFDSYCGITQLYSTL